MYKFRLLLYYFFRGVTTVVDGGSSGCMTYPGLKRFVMDKSETRVLAWLHIACHGMNCQFINPTSDKYSSFLLPFIV